MPLPDSLLSTILQSPEFNILLESQGIPKNDLIALLQFAHNENVIILIRPVERLTKSLQEEKHPTKNFKIKGKSSSWGLWAGFIPIDQALSKLFDANSAIIDKANKEVQACIDQKHALETHLKITEKRFQELEEKEIIYPQKKKDGEYLVIYCPRPHSDTFELCYAKKINTESEAEYAIYTTEKKPFYVLADTVLKRPLIADYDLLAIFTPWKEYSQENVRRNPDITFERHIRKRSPNTQRHSQNTPEKYYAQEDPNLGNVAPLIEKIIIELNKILDKGYGLNCFHHNDDAGSPASNPAANYPITVITPKGIRVIKDENGLVNFIYEILPNHYRVAVNPLWGPAVNWAATSDYHFNKITLAYRFDNSQENMERTLAEVFKSIDLSDALFTKELANLFKLMTEVKSDTNTLSSRQEEDDLQIREAGDRRGFLAAQISYEQNHLPVKKLIKNFFSIIQESLFVNSTLVVNLGHSFEELKKKKALSEKNIDKLITLTKILKNNIKDLYEILNHLPMVRAELISDYFTLAETHICNNKLNVMKFKNLVANMIDETSREQNLLSMRP